MTNKSWFFLLLVLMIVLMVPALINGYPLIYPDSADYVILTPIVYRSPFYQSFVFFTSWKRTLWPTVIMQSLITSITILLFLQTELNPSRRQAWLSAAFVSIFSSVSIYVSFIMPDTFTGVVLLCVYLLTVRWSDMAVGQRIIVSLIAYIAILSHLSHLVGAAAALSTAIILLICNGTAKREFFGICSAIVILIVCAVSATMYNVAEFRTLAISPAGSTFFSANLIEMGPGRNQLLSDCKTQNWQICANAQSLPHTADEMLWHNGPIQRIGFKNMKPASDKIVLDTLTEQPLAVIDAIIKNSLRASMSFLPGAEIFAAPNGTAKVIAIVYPHEKPEFDESLQARGAFPTRVFNSLSVASVILSILFMAFHWFFKRSASYILPLYMLAVYFLNAALCGALSGVHDRYQARVSWLVPLAAVTMIAAVIRAKAEAKCSVRTSGGSG